MTKLEDLIQMLCPNGVTYVKFGNIASIVRGSSPRPISMFITDDANGVNWIKIGDVSPESKYITNSKEKITPEGATKSRLVKPGDFVLSNSMSFGRPYILKIEGCIHDGWLSISKFERTYLPDFLYYLISSNTVQQEMAKRASFGGAVQNLNADIVKAIELPIPPLPVQREIVRILDNFTELTAKLTADLTTELAARKKQYEHYCRRIVEQGNNSISAKIRNLGTWSGGSTPSMSNKLFWENGNIPWISSKDMKSSILTDTQDHLTQSTLAETSIKLFPANTVAIVARSGILKHTLPIVFIPFETTVNQDIKILVANDNVLPKYAFYALQGYHNELLAKTKKQGGTVDSLDTSKFMDFEIPLPSLQEQARIVSILDRFDTLCNDLTTGLPAEIEARKKQYEYYRDKLLTFPEAYS